MRISLKHIGRSGKYSLVVITALLSFRCVESVTDSTSAATPSITIYSPKTGDTVRVGKNLINYAASDGSGGTGLSYYELYINGTYSQKITQNTDGTNPAIYLALDSTYLHKRFSYYINVYNKAGKIKTSKTQDNIYVMDKLPAAPGNLILSSISNNEVLLHWDDSSSNEAGFELWRKDVGGTTSIDYRKIATLSPNTITTRDGGLSPFVAYYYKVRAFNESGYSNFSNEASTSSSTGGPWNLRAEAIGASSVRLLWNDFVTNEDGFLIERTDPTTNAFKVLALTNPNTTEYYDNTVSANTGYTYRIAYFVKQSNSPYSNEASVSTYYKDFSAPSDLTATDLGAGSIILLHWTDNNPNIQQGTIVERKDGGNSDYNQIATVLKDSTIFHDSLNLQPGTQYIYRVRQILYQNTYTPFSNTTTPIIKK
jgi:Fibronectin type III domain